MFCSERDREKEKETPCARSCRVRASWRTFLEEMAMAADEVCIGERFWLGQESTLYILYHLYIDESWATLYRRSMEAMAADKVARIRKRGGREGESERARGREGGRKR